MAIVLMMQMPVDEVVNMVPVGHSLMPTARTVHVIGRMAGAAMSTGTRLGIARRYSDRVFFYLPFRVLVMEMAVVQIIDMVPVLDCRMAAA